MKLMQVLKLFLLAHCSSVYGGRGTIHRNTDEEFQMLLVGGLIPENGQFVNNIVSIRTLDYIEHPGDNHFCMGVVISSQVVLTAAHCITDEHRATMSPRTLLIVFGIFYRMEYYTHDDSRRVTDIRIHPKYRRYVNYDVALLRLHKRIPRNLRHVRPILLKNVDHIEDGTRCVTLGWGQVYPHGPYANELMYLDVTIRSPAVCKDMYKYTEECTICAEPDVRGQICPGDLGGPLVCNNHISGIIGGTLGCTGIKSLKFVNFSHVYAWIAKTTAQMGTSNMWPSIYVHILCLLHLLLVSNLLLI